MELTLNLPDELAERLPRHEDQLALVLHLGLQALRGGDQEAEAPLPPGWRTALLEMQNERRASLGESPAVEELLAYHRGQLSPEEVDDLLERLLADPQTTRDLLDLMEFESPEPSAGQASTAAALGVFRQRVAHPVEEADTDPGSSAAAPRTRFPFPKRPMRWLAQAAALLLALGAGWILGPHQPGDGLEQATVIEVATSRGARSFPVSSTGEEILIILPHAESTHGGSGTLRVSGPGGEPIYEGTFQARKDPWSRIYVRLPSTRLIAGTYLLKISRDPPADGESEYWFTLEVPPTGKT